jgi:hypothetical protein
MENSTTTENPQQIQADAEGIYDDTARWLPAYQLASLALEVNWRRIDHSEQAARKFYREVAAENPDELRWLASEALAAAGWTYRTVRFRKS